MTEADYRRQFDLSGRVAVVTGACGLLGRQFCRGLAQFGANVALLDVRAEALRVDAAKLANDHGVRTVGIDCDVSDPSAVERAIHSVLGQLGGIDILLNNAQSTTTDPRAYFAPFENYDPAEWRRVLSIDLDGMALVAQAVCRHMTRSGRGGSLIQMASIYGAFGPDNRIYADAQYRGAAINTPAVYSVGKAGVLGLTRWLATSYASHGIRANAIIPGGVEDGQSAEFQTRYSARVPLGRMARRDEVVGAMIWLASDASSYVTGQGIFVDGGLSAW